MASSGELNAWRRRLRTTRQLAEMLASGRQVWMYEEDLYATPLDRGPGVVVYDFDRRTGVFSVRYRIVGIVTNLDPY